MRLPTSKTHAVENLVAEPTEFRLLCICLVLTVGAMCLRAQQPATANQPATAPEIEQPAPPVQTPGEIYKAAMHPLDVVRGSLDNWSDAEVGALAVGMHKAHDACEAAEPREYAGDDLYDLIRLCALGQDWQNANAAAQVYIASRLEPHRAQAYALAINAMVHMNAVDLATETTREMLRLPYDAEVAYAVRYMKDELEQRSDPEALKLAGEEHPAIVAALAKKVPLKATNGDAVVSVGALVESAMELAFWQQYAGDAPAADATVSDVEQALPPNSPLSADDTARIAAVRLRYGLLDKPLPELTPTRSLESPTAKPSIPTGGGTITILVLFPDWCGGCRKLMKPLTDFVKVNKDIPIRAFGLVFLDDSVIPDPAAHEQILKELKGTSTLVVPPSTVQTLGANDFPLGIVLDKQGKVRFIGNLPGNAFNGNGYMEKTILRIVSRNKDAPLPAEKPKMHDQ